MHVCRWPGRSSPPTALQWNKHIFIARTADIQRVSPGLNHGRWNHSFWHIQSLFFLPRSPCVPFQKHVFYCLPLPSHLLRGPFLQVIDSIMEPWKLIGPKIGRNCWCLSTDSSPLVHIHGYFLWLLFMSMDSSPLVHIHWLLFISTDTSSLVHHWLLSGASPSHQASHPCICLLTKGSSRPHVHVVFFVWHAFFFSCSVKSCCFPTFLNYLSLPDSCWTASSPSPDTVSHRGSTAFLSMHLIGWLSPDTIFHRGSTVFVSTHLIGWLP